MIGDLPQSMIISMEFLD